MYYIIYSDENKEVYPLARANEDKLSLLADCYVELSNFARDINLYPNSSCFLSLMKLDKDMNIVKFPAYDDKSEMMVRFIDLTLTPYKMNR